MASDIEFAFVPVLPCQGALGCCPRRVDRPIVSAIATVLPSCSLQLYLYDMGTTLALGSLVCSQLACSARFAPPRLPALSDRWPATPSSDGRMHWPGSHASLARAPRLPPAYPHGYGMARLCLTGMGLAPLGALWHFAMASSRLAHKGSRPADFSAGRAATSLTLAAAVAAPLLRTSDQPLQQPAATFVNAGTT